MNNECRIKNLSELKAECGRLSVQVSVDEDVSVLGENVPIGVKILPNRFCVQPMEGADAEEDGSPGEFTFRRYLRYAEGGFGLIWVEATAIKAEARSNPGQLFLTHENVGEFKGFVDAVRLAGRKDMMLVLQLAHAGRFSNPNGVLDPKSAADVTDDYLDELQNSYLKAAALAAEAGFDGVDIKSCHGCLVSELINLEGRDGRYGGTFENRTRFLLETISRIRDEEPGILVTTRMGVKDVPEKIEEAVKLVKMLKALGVQLLGVSVEDTFVGSDIGKARNLVAPKGSEDEPLTGLARVMEVTGQIQKAVPDMAVVGGGYSWFRDLVPQIAAGQIRSGAVSIIGMGRGALAYPSMAADVLKKGKMNPAECCITCSSCIQLLRDGGKAGCVIKDSAIYGGEYRHRRHYSIDNLKREAGRCHDCVNAPCKEACPVRINVPGFIKAFEEGDVKASYGILCESNVLPEMCANLCPVSMQCEGACIESHLSGQPVLIHEIQYAVSCMARQAGMVGLDIPKERTGRKVAVVGAGPAGISAAVKLLEKGHEVVIYERDKRAGGTPEMLIRAERYVSAAGEIDAILKPALRAGALQVRYGEELGKTVKLAELKGEYDAVLLASGLWNELPLDEDVQADGVVDALTFLKKVKSGELWALPSRVALLSGGDCAMDSAVEAMRLGVEELYIVYGGRMSEMHWHMNDSWCRTEGVHFVTLTDPVGYDVDGAGKLKGLKVCRVDPESLEYVSGGEYTLEVDMVIEAIGLGIDEGLEEELAGMSFSEYGLLEPLREGSFAVAHDGVFAVGALINGGASVVQCVAEGMKVAEEIDKYM